MIALSQKHGEELKQELIKLSKDAKNTDYLDQLYYTLGELERKEGNIEKAIEYYTLSAKFSKGNSNQKGMSYLCWPITTFQKPTTLAPRPTTTAPIPHSTIHTRNFNELSKRQSFSTLWLMISIP